MLLFSRDPIFFFLFFFETEFFSLPRLECNGAISAHRNLCLLGSGNSPASASWAGITATHHHARLIFFLYFLVETGFYHVDQDGLNFLTLWSTRLSLPKCWDYRREPLYLTKKSFLLLVDSQDESNSNCLYVLTLRQWFNYKMFRRWILGFSGN